MLSALLAEVEATGEKVLICRHGKPAADLVPHRKHSRLEPHPVMRKIASATIRRAADRGRVAGGCVRHRQRKGVRKQRILHEPTKQRLIGHIVEDGDRGAECLGHDPPIAPLLLRRVRAGDEQQDQGLWLLERPWGKDLEAMPPGDALPDLRGEL